MKLYNGEARALYDVHPRFFYLKHRNISEKFKLADAPSAEASN